MWWLWQSGLVHARAGRFPDAAADLSRYLADKPANLEQLTIHAAILLLAGDRDGYRRICEQVLRRDAAKENERGARLRLPASVRWRRWKGWTEKRWRASRHQALASDPRAGWNLHTLGMVQLRAGQFAAATATFRKSLTETKDEKVRVVNWQALALARAATGQTRRSRRLAEEARDWWTDTAPKLPPFLVNSPFPIHPHDWLAAQLLRRELDEVMRDRN